MRGFGGHRNSPMELVELRRELRLSIVICGGLADIASSGQDWGSPIAIEVCNCLHEKRWGTTRYAMLVAESPDYGIKSVRDRLTDDIELSNR